MSTENIAAFFAKVDSDPALAEKLAQANAEAIASVASAEGLPFTAEEFLQEQQALLSDEALSSVAGGVTGTSGTYGEPVVMGTGITDRNGRTIMMVTRPRVPNPSIRIRPQE